MNGDIRIIRTFTNPWPRDSPERYYVDFWQDRIDFNDAVRDYYNDMHIDEHDKKSQIHVFFDKFGTLKITNCKNPILKERIENYIVNLYNWEIRNNNSIHHSYYHVETIIEPYLIPLEKGFVQVRYKDLVVNLSPEQQSSVLAVSHAAFHSVSDLMIMDYDSGIQKFNDIVYKIVADGNIFPNRLDPSAPNYDLQFKMGMNNLSNLLP